VADGWPVDHQGSAIGGRRQRHWAPPLRRPRW
jgi:hypothetical protein